MKSQIWIPSKGRPAPSFSRMLCKEGIAHEVWIEPQDERAYREAYNEIKESSGIVNLRVIPENDMGITYVRQRMLESIRRHSYKVFMFDDDIRGFFRVIDKQDGKGRKRESISLADALKESEDMFINAKLGYGCFVHNVFCVFAPAGLNSKRLDTGSIWLDGERLPKHLNYNAVSGREDLYFAVMSMLTGVPSAICNDITVNHAPAGDPKMKGGLAEWYAKWEENVLKANKEVEDLLESAAQTAISKLSPEKRKKFADFKVFRQYELKHGVRKGMQDARPKWSAIAKLCEALSKESAFL